MTEALSRSKLGGLRGVPKGYSPVGALVEGGVVPQHHPFRPQQPPPEEGVHTHVESWRHTRSRLS